MSYGPELILDLYNCNTDKFNRQSINAYFKEICKAINVEPDELFFWDDIELPEEEKQTSPKTKGTSAVQFILTSSIVIHTLDLLGLVFINIFSCKEFSTVAAINISIDWFEAQTYRYQSITRGRSIE